MPDDRPGSHPMAVSDAVSVIGPVIKCGERLGAVVETMVLLFRSLFVLASQFELLPIYF